MTSAPYHRGPHEKQGAWQNLHRKCSKNRSFCETCSIYAPSALARWILGFCPGALWQGTPCFFILLVSLSSVPVIKHRLALERALVQWRRFRELSKWYLCGHRYSLGTVRLLDDTQVLCVSWRLLPLFPATWGCFGEACSSVKL